MEKYSVLMSLYYKEKPANLDLAIKSMVEQTLTPDEIVIVKDGPITEELQTVLDKYVDLYPNIFNIVGYDVNKGLGYALNYGLAHCKNELVARMDTDDISKPYRCMEQVKLFSKNNSLDIVGGDIEEFVDDTINIIGERKVPCDDKDIKAYMQTRCAFNHVSVMFKKTSVENAGGYQDWFWNEDYFLWIRMLLNKATFANTGTTLVSVRGGKEMYSRRGGMKYFDSEYRIQKYMYRNEIIGLPVFTINVLKRFIVQVMLPNSLRGWVYKKFARN